MRVRYAYLMKLKGLKQKDVVAYTGIPASTLSEWKNGKYELSMDKIVAIADCLGVSLDYLVLGKSDAVSTLEATFNELNAEGQELLLERASELIKLGYIKSNKAGMVGA